MDGFYDLPTQGDIVPRVANTEIVLCRGIEWDNAYEHVRMFNNEPELLAHVKSKCPTLGSSPYNITTATPVSGGKMRVKIPEMESKLMDLNYLAYNNKGFIDRWFYAFITDLKWLSDNSCIIEFELDVFQNCAYRTNYNACFIHREHIAKFQDTYGANTVPENLETGNFRDNYVYLETYGNQSIGMLVTETLNGKNVEGGMVGNVYQGARLTILDGDTIEEVVGLANGLLTNYNDKGKIDSIVGVFMIPEICRQGRIDNTVVSASHAFEGYVPKNNKLYTYPYCYCLVDNNAGSTGVFKFELSLAKNNTISFQCIGTLSPQAGVQMRTLDYNTAGNNELGSINFTGFPQCSWSSDVYKAWSAQNKNMLSLQSATNALKPLTGMAQGAISGGLLGGGAGAGVGSAVGAIAGAISGFSNQAQLMAMAMDKEIEPPQIHGKANALNLNASLNLLRMDFHVMSMTADNARSVDDFFTAYGYAVNKLKAPNINTRPYWNFVKTSGCSFTGPFPTDMMKGFRAIFDKGVTIWHTNDIGNYGLDNNQ